MNALLPILLVAFLGIMFMASRRQKKEARAVTTMQDALSAGDKVMTTSGLQGTITDLDEDTVNLEIAPGVVTTWNRLAIRSVVPVGDAQDHQVDEDTDEELPASGTLDPTAPSLRKD